MTLIDDLRVKKKWGYNNARISVKIGPMMFPIIDLKSGKWVACKMTHNGGKI